MRQKRKYTILIYALFMVFIFSGMGTSLGQESVVRAVIFFSPTCGHCGIVRTEVTIPMCEHYGNQIVILEIDVSIQEGNDIYQAAKITHPRLAELPGIPALVVGDIVLVGSGEIPNQFPGIVADGLEASGIDWPDIPGLQEYIEARGEDVPTTSTNSIAEKFNRDILGNSLSVFILVGMLFAAIRVGVGFYRSDMGEKIWPAWVILLLIVIGMIAAIYLSYVEVTLTEAFCGPVGDCNAVQQSEYAKLFGFIPMAVFGLAGYIFILIAWILKTIGPKKWYKSVMVALVILTGFGTLFSMCLTFMEPFVLGATCSWCLISAVMMTLLFWSSSVEYLNIGKSHKGKKRKRR